MESVGYSHHQQNQSRLSPARPTQPPSEVSPTPPHKSAPTHPAQCCSLAAIFAPCCQSTAAQLCSHLLAMPKQQQFVQARGASSPCPNHASTPSPPSLCPAPTAKLFRSHRPSTFSKQPGFVKVKPCLSITLQVAICQYVRGMANRNSATWWRLMTV